MITMVSCTGSGPKYRIGVSQCVGGLWRETINMEMLRESDYYADMTVDIRTSKANSKEQIHDIEELVKEGLDILIVSPNESQELTPIVSEVYRSGIPVILLDRKTGNDQYSAYIGADNRQIGQMAAEYTINKLPSGAKIVILRGVIGSSADQERYEGFMGVISAHSNYRVLAEVYGEFKYTDGYERFTTVLDSLLSRGELPDAIFCLNDSMARSVAEVYKAKGMSAKPLIMGVDALNDDNGGMGFVSQGIISATCMYPTRGDEVIALARAILMNEPYSRENILSTSVVDKDNVRIFRAQANQIMSQQEKLGLISKRMIDATQRYFHQRLVMTSFIILTLIAMISLIMLLRSWFKMNNLNERLNSQNIKITNQLEELQHQKRDLVLLSEQLETTTQAKLSFFTNISHEFKTPLSLISGPIDDLSVMEGMPKEASSKLDILKRNSSKLSRLIAELLDFRSVEAGTVPINYSKGNIKSFLSNIIDMFQGVIARRNIKFEFNTSDSDFEVNFDPVKVEKIFTNLLSNAFNHIDRSGTITVNLSLEEGSSRQIIFSVFNSGSYIPVELRKKIFKEFYTLSPDQKGTGIGLSLVKALVDTLSGTIEVESDKDTGTKFVVTLPVSEKIDSDITTENHNYTPSFALLKRDTMGSDNDDSDIMEEIESNGLQSVLVIEDNVDMRLYIKESLSSSYHVILAENGEIGLEKALKYVPDIIICDIMMPQKDGYEVCTEIRSTLKIKNIPIILLTACSSDEQKARGYECGADAYMEKPFSVTTLKVRINKLIEKNRQREEEATGLDFLQSASQDMTSESVQLVNKIRKYVDAHINEEIRVDDLLRESNMSRSKFYKLINEISPDYSPIDIVNRIRIKNALNLIVKENQNISEAAFNSGFTSGSYFTRSFQKYYNESPSKYLEKHMATKQ